MYRTYQKSNLQKKIEITEDSVEHFYNSNEIRFNVIARLIAREGGEETDTLRDVVCDALQEASPNTAPDAESRRSERNYKEAISASNTTNEGQFPRPIPVCQRWVIDRKYQKIPRTTVLSCALCGCERYVMDGAYLASAVQTLTGHYPTLGLWNDPFDIMDHIVATLQEHLDLISDSDTLVAHDVASFFNDYLVKYVENDEWKIMEPAEEWRRRRIVFE
ncbi:unnamed protein product [Strongylus vulgaris]|uniref:Uncharacterized protein n=1 Tax=Strongylus vulgaris TaxID=40348 RepID=A0A3P7J8S5_STRVU|nr:unnamed protein product [Strongylus vulgaris]